jgi:SAM-dependent methyltransferase
VARGTEEHYKDYWVGEQEGRSRRRYYERLYGRLKSKIQVPSGARVLDVAGGNGQFLQYLELQRADILDISESGLKAAREAGFRTVQGDIEGRFPIEPGSYDVALCFEVLEHLHAPNKTLSEIHNVLAPQGVLYVGQPNMPADGVDHVRRYYLKPLVSDLEKCGFCVEWIDYVPAYSMPEAILDDIRRNPSWARKAIQCVNLSLSLLPRGVRYRMARAWPDRFALLLILKAVKK